MCRERHPEDHVSTIPINHIAKLVGDKCHHLRAISVPSNPVQFTLPSGSLCFDSLSFSYIVPHATQNPR